MEFSKLTERAAAIRRRYAAFEKARYGRTWTNEEIALGFVGALLGMWIARLMGLPELFPVRIGGTSFPIIWSIIGSAVFVAVITLITRSRV